jgi:HlyD family secretion protein
MTKNQTAELNRDTQALLGEDAVRPFWKKPLTWLLICLVLAALAYFFLWPSSGSKAAVSYKTAKVETGDLVIEVSANGTLNPIRTVSIGSELSGVVRKVNVDVNDEIKTGQVLVELDDTKLKAAVERARATLALSEAGLAEAQATEKEARVKLQRLQEVRRLSGGKSPSKTEIDSQEAVLARAVASVSSAKAQILDSQEALKSAETDLSKSQISSPIDGIVLTRTVENGQAVAASLQAVELLSLATDMRHLELQINVDEADVGAVKPGLPAYFTVSAYPDRRFPATLKKVAFGSTTTDNVVTYITYLDVDNPQLDLRPGMTATANIRTVSLKDATLVPNTALRFKPSNAAPAKESVTAGMFGPPKHDAVQKTAKDVGGSAGVQREGTVYVLRNGAPQAVKLVIGYSDGKMTQVIKGDISPKDEVIVNQLRGAK